MPINPPSGFLTRPEAAKKYNRSQRALERDLDRALAMRDADVLLHWKLITKDGQIRGGGEITIEKVKELVGDGMTPAWCIEEAYLEEEFGRKGSPKRRGSGEIEQPQNPHSGAGLEEGTAKATESSSAKPLSDDVTFLKERIWGLEEEKRQERLRHDTIVRNLFGELDVKNKQISAWDEVTQGLTKALATGQIRPNTGGLLVDVKSSDVPTVLKKEDPRPTATHENHGTEDVIDAVTKAPAETRAKAEQNRSRRAPRTKARPKKTKSVRTKLKTATKKPRARKPRPGKAKWHEIPTFKRAASRFFSRQR
jgi:hypothetical protein